MAGRGKRNLSGSGGGKSLKDNNSSTGTTSTNTSRKQIASWSEIKEQSEGLESIFGLADLSQVKLEDKMDLMMVAMVKLHKVMEDKFDSISVAINKEEEGIEPRLSLVLRMLAFL